MTWDTENNLLDNHQNLNSSFWEQVGLKGEALSLHTPSGSSSVEWTGGSTLAQNQPLIWYKVKITSKKKTLNDNCKSGSTIKIGSCFVCRQLSMPPEEILH